MKALLNIPMTLVNMKPRRERKGDDPLGALALDLKFEGNLGERSIAQFFDSKKAYGEFEDATWDADEVVKRKVEKIEFSDEIIGGTVTLTTDLTSSMIADFEEATVDKLVMYPKEGRVCRVSLRIRAHATPDQAAKIYEQQKIEFRITAARPTAEKQKEIAARNGKKETQDEMKLPLKREDAEKQLDEGIEPEPAAKAEPEQAAASEPPKKKQRPGRRAVAVH